MSCPSPLLLVVGLGNPGSDYCHTRHNAGFWFADQLADRCHEVFRNEAKFSGQLCRIEAAAQDGCWLFKPMTFMNRSGSAVARLRSYFDVPLRQMLVAHDDLDLPPGAVRLKRGGGHGGHNGLRDLLACLGDDDFYRLRVGIGHPGDRDRVVGYVLARPSEAERRAIEEGLTAAVSLYSQILAGEMQLAMNQLHSRS
jgi:PTH1 family peptidyl-tRNA hydrolase